MSSDTQACPSSVLITVNITLALSKMLGNRAGFAKGAIVPETPMGIYITLLAALAASPLH